MSRVLLGSMAEAITGRVPTSILIARHSPSKGRILVATDGSPESDRAVTLALELASARGAELIVEHVVEYAGKAETAPPEGYLQGIIERMTLPTPPRVRYVIDVGAPADQIVRRAESENCDLVVVGARGMGRVKGALLGSVSHRVANSTRANVLIVRGEREE